MERESAVREILQSIGPLFPEDAQRARAARRQAQQEAQQEAEAAAVAEAPVEQAPRVKLTTAPKPVLASQVDGPNIQKTHVATLAAVLERLVPPPTPPSVRDTLPELVQAAPNVNALRAALNLREPASEPAPVVAPVAEAPPAFTELPSDPAVTILPDDELIEAEDVVFLEPSAEEIQAALAEAVEAQRDTTEKTPPAPAPEPVAPAPEFSEDEHDAFVSAIADAILPARPYPAVVRAEATATVAPAVQTEPAAETVVATADRSVVTATPRDATPKAKFKRAKPKQAAANGKPEVVAAPVAKAPEPQVQPEPARSAEDDELIRQIRVHRDDMVDVDDQIARMDQEIAATQHAMAQYVAALEQKNAHRSRLVRLRTSTQRFVDTLQVRAEPVKRQPKEKKSA